MEKRKAVIFLKPRCLGSWLVCCATGVSVLVGWLWEVQRKLQSRVYYLDRLLPRADKTLAKMGQACLKTKAAYDTKAQLVCKTRFQFIDLVYFKSSGCSPSLNNTPYLLCDKILLSWIRFPKTS